MPEITTLPALRDAVRAARTVAVLGAHHDPARAACYVPEYLHGRGLRVLSVNPALVGRTLWGEPVRATLSSLGEPVDIVDVFRRPELLAGHLADLLAMKPLPKLVWLQQGIRNEAFAQALLAAGIDVVQDRCLFVDHRALA
jgi:hypothetical protein